MKVTNFQDAAEIADWEFEGLQVWNKHENKIHLSIFSEGFHITPVFVYYCMQDYVNIDIIRVILCLVSELVL